MDRYAVIGSPIGHSLSPRIHTLFAEQTGQQLQYTAIEVRQNDFFGDINKLVGEGFKGLNVTVPLKELAWEMADSCNELANRAKAVNTLSFENDRRNGFNTDGLGLLRDLTINHQIDLSGKQILVLGAGGAVRGVLAPLLNANPAAVVIANRTAEKAAALAREFVDLGPIRGGGFDAPGQSSFDIIINGTSAGLNGEIPSLPDSILTQGGITYDMVYARQPTAFVQWGLAHGAGQALDGLGMLVEQAAEAFQIWRGIRPDSRAVMAALR